MNYLKEKILLDKNERKSASGITLVALVITVIVLLILAGISLNLIMGDGGILNKATNARKTTDISSAQEKVELLVAEYAYNYLQEKYVNGNGTFAQDKDAYIVGQLNTNASNNFEECVLAVNTTDKKVTLSKDGKTVTGTVQNGALSWASTESGNSSGGNHQQAVTLNIGDDVDYTTSLNGVTLDDWKVFYTEGDYTYLIYGDYLPSAAIPTNLLTVIGTADDPYGVWDKGNNRSNFLNALTLKSNWECLLSGTINQHVINEVNNSSALAMAAPTIELWVDSWNASYPNDRLYICYKSEIIDPDYDESASWDGWYIGVFENPDQEESYAANISNKVGMSNLLYCPRGEYVGDCLGYRISSPSAKDDYDSMSFSCDGLVMPEYYEGDFVSALRPVIKLPNSVFSE